MSYISAFQGNYIDNQIGKNLATINDINNIWKTIYPVGSIYLSMNNINPSTLFGGTWSQIEGSYLYAIVNSEDYSAGSTFGSWSHSHTTGDCTLTINQVPAHTHTRGTMEITGGIRCYSDYNYNNDEYWTKGVKGSFYKDPNWQNEVGSSNNQSTSATADAVRNVSFMASKAWTGETSSIGGGAAHNHGDTGSATVQPPSIRVYVWLRTA